jgi:hypothetical protein
MMKVKQFLLVDGIEFEVAYSRRRYIGITKMQFYTWLHVKVDNEWHEIGEPWPCVTPKKEEQRQAIRDLLKELGRVQVCEGS